jgi:protein-L-isoaspartate(D-aspartate) O-methyltransferase
VIGVETARRDLAARLRDELGLRSEPLVHALATVPREFFLGPGPWLVLRVPEGYTSTPDADPVHVVRDVPVALDASRLINNGAPSLVAAMIDALAPREGTSVLHVGAGVGYWTAILAEMVGPSGHVTALEIDRPLAARARRNLAGWKNVELIEADGSRHRGRDLDAIFVSAGATHPRAVWLEALAPGGRLLVPLTGLRPPPPAARFGRNLAGRALLLERGESGGFSARFLMGVGLSPLLGGRDFAHERRLQEAYGRGEAEEVQSLRTDPHPAGPTCWLHDEAFCLSKRARA